VDVNAPTDNPISIIALNDGSEPATNARFRVSLPGGATAANDITVMYQLGGTAQQGVDYTLGTAVIPAGASGADITVNVTDDYILEPTETVEIQLLGANGKNAGGDAVYFPADATAGSAAVNLADDDNTDANRSLEIVRVDDGAEPGTSGHYEIRLPEAVPGQRYTASSDISVRLTYSGTAAMGADYTAATTVTLPLGSSGVVVPVSINDDKIIEGSESVTATVTGGDAGSLGSFSAAAAGSNATLTIADDDNTAVNKVLSIVTTADGAEPGTNGAFTIRLPAGVTATEDITVSYSTGGTATGDADYVAPGGSITIPAGQNSVTLPVTVKDDQQIEGDEQVVVTLAGGSSASYGAFTAGAAYQAVTTIADDDNKAANRVLSIAVTTGAAEPGTNGAFTISLPAGITTAEPVTVQYSISGTASGGADYTALSGTAVIPAGAGSVTVSVQPIDDKIIEGDETVVLTLTGGSAATGSFSGSSAATMTIADDDNTVPNKQLSVSNSGNGTEPGGSGSFTISLPAGVTAAADITVTYSTGGTATNGTDYTALSGTVVIPAGSNSVSIPVRITDDKIIEGDETVVLTVTGGTTADFGSFGGGGTATVTIGDDDNTAANQAISLSGSGMAAEPGTNGSFTLSLPAGVTAAQDITVSYTVGGTAVAGSDYTALSGTVVIPAGSNSITLPVRVIDDALIENNETVIVTLAGATAGSLGSFSATGEATVTITDNDGTANVLNVTASIANAAEPSTNGAFTISLPGGAAAAGDVAVNYTISGTAKAGTDYVALSGTAVIPAGSNSVQIPVQVIDNQTADGTRTVVLTLTGGEMARVVFVPGQSNKATVTISDNDIADFVTWKTVTLPGANNAVHGGDQLTYTIHVRNTGTIPIPAVTISDPVPAHTSYVSGGTLNGGVVNFNLSNLAAGATAEVSFVVQADGDLRGVTTITNTAQVSDGLQTKPTGGCDPSAPGCSAGPGTVIRVAGGDLLITKKVSEPFMPPYRMGMDITYRITVTNKGDLPFSGVTVTDTIPAGLQLPKSTLATRGQVTVDPSTRILSWTPGNMAAGEELQLSLVCRVIEGGELTNTAVVSAAEADSDTTNNRAVSTITVQGLDLYFPNTITPNGDGKNDKFIIGGLEKYPGSRIRIYNRWGSEVYRSEGYNNDWDGGNLTSGVYFYVLEVKTGSGVKPFKGWIQILR
jgi:gliding motility-associated-like protein/uncharacterized repeat protein (TIGR01451 family)